MRIMGGLLASAYLRTVFLWMPNSLAIARMERPQSLACCTGFHRTLCRGVGFLRGDAGGLRTLLSPFNVALSASMTPRAARLFLGWLPTPLTLRSRLGPYRRGPCLGRIICAALPWSESFSVECGLWLRRTFHRAQARPLDITQQPQSGSESPTPSSSRAKFPTW